ncbi:MAG: pirin family protein [Chloroflexi bacterium]|nr:pirin family protein [Chloroflexota bacterium]
MDIFASVITDLVDSTADFQHIPAEKMPTIHPIHWLTSHFAVGGYSPLQRLGGMLTAHMTQIAPRNGFTWHPHRGLEIYTYVIEGELYHEDTTGGRGFIGAGEVQRMFSGNYIAHQELNLSNEFTRVIQIWFAADPAHQQVQPHYEQIALEAMPLRQVGSAAVREIIGPNGATTSHVRQARLTSIELPAHGRTTLELPQPGEDLFLYLVKGQGSIEHNGRQSPFNLYDVALATPHTTAPVLHTAASPLIALAFYLPPFITDSMG